MENTDRVRTTRRMTRALHTLASEVRMMIRRYDIMETEWLSIGLLDPRSEEVWFQMQEMEAEINDKLNIIKGA